VCFSNVLAVLNLYCRYSYETTVSFNVNTESGSVHCVGADILDNQTRMYLLI
jgi:hypothetical protein